MIVKHAENMARNSGLSEYPKLLGKQSKTENKFQVHHGSRSGKQFSHR